ncbi:MAG: hypothetical protein ACRCVX_14240 [Shewanella sp.]
MRAIYDRFIELHPNSDEAYSEDFECLARWHYANIAAESRMNDALQLFKFPESGGAIDLAKSRSVSSFEQFPKETQEKYKRLAASLSHRAVYAVGSRVNGDYIDQGETDQRVIDMRALMMKKETLESDYDFTLDINEGENLDNLFDSIPKGFDLVVNLPPDEQKILIPMWDFSKLPKDRHNEVIEIVENQQWGRLMDIHNEYGLSNQTLCCTHEPAKQWFTWAIENNLISRVDAE